jgi:predicted GTPase
LKTGSGVIAAQLYGATQLIDPRPYAVGSLRDCFARYPWIGKALPAEGYSAAQVAELQDTIRRVPCDTVLIATPVDLGRLFQIAQPSARVTYTLVEVTEPTLPQLIDSFLERQP